MRRTLNWLALFVFTAGSIAALVQVIRAERAAAPPFTHDDLQAWLVESHGPGDPGNAAAVRRRAARQLDQDFHAPFDWQPYFAELPAATQEKFLANFRSLLAQLIEQRADSYFSLARQHREAFLDAEVNDLATWYVVGKEGRSSGFGLFQQGVLAMNSGELNGPGAKKTREFVSAFQSHLMKRSLGHILPLSGSTPKRDD